ncbi:MULTISPECIES: hypothetical protein [Trichocoleus]|uniref:Uncharacterized protein n=1 Tax=Trichocoleus desertorum GB2-A4 TaxID=2933944 RepID=A0ABV0JFB7_9CYAN|nr:hypothetical protein [Trichocoleus sp. FACHB-46]MBD1864536.1 hypothetical protein [Trichocoleus sp. FACHB-46]
MMNNPCNESFSVLLTQGQIADAFENRITELEQEAHEFRLDVESGKLLSAALGVVGLVLSANPVIAVLGGFGVCGYAWMVLTDYQKTKKLLPIPCLRKGVFELFAAAGEYSDTRQVQPDDPTDDVSSCLPPAQATEYQLLVLAGDRLVPFLKQVPAERRFAAYRYTLRQAAIRHALPTLEEAIAASDAPAFPTTDTGLQAATELLPANTEQATPADTTLQAAAPTALQWPDNPGDRPADTPVDTPVEGALNLSSGTLEERIELLMDALERDGFPIVRLIDEPFLWSYGESQSGKTTIINLVNACRLGLGFKVSYASTDNDFPPLKWDRLAIGEAKYRDYLDTVVELASEAKKGQLEGTAFTLDEIFQVAQILELDLNPLMTAAIAKANKSRACYSFITQNDTLTGLKLEGVRDALENMRVFITAHAVRPEKRGRPHPSGSYTIQFPKGQPERWTLPAWILTETNGYGEPDPVQWVLNRLPELSASQARPVEPQQQAETPVQTRQQLENLLALEFNVTPQLPSDSQPEQKAIAPHLQAIIDYFQKRSERLKPRDVSRASLAALKNVSTDKIRGYMDELAKLNVLQCEGDVFYLK